MNWKTRVILSISAFAILGGIVASSGRVIANTKTNNDLAHKLAVHFNLNENDVRNFIDDYYADKKEEKTGTNQQTDHIQFIDAKLSQGVEDGWLTKVQKKDVIAKLKEMMGKSPSSASFANMSEDQQTDTINTWKKEMRTWAREHNLTLDAIRNLTGKGNKYLMGIELD
jgi:hypothetical protein